MQRLIVQDIWFKANCADGLQVPELKIREEQMMLQKTSFQLAQRTCQILAALRRLGKVVADTACVFGPEIVTLTTKASSTKSSWMSLIMMTPELVPISR